MGLEIIKKHACDTDNTVIRVAIIKVKHAKNKVVKLQPYVCSRTDK